MKRALAPLPNGCSTFTGHVTLSSTDPRPPHGSVVSGFIAEPGGMQ
jgi:hypothetical protein